MKQKKFIRLTQDLMFKSFFSKDKAVLSSLLKNFLPALKNKEIINIQILNPENINLDQTNRNEKNNQQTNNESLVSLKKTDQIEEIETEETETEKQKNEKKSREKETQSEEEKQTKKKPRTKEEKLSQEKKQNEEKAQTTEEIQREQEKLITLDSAIYPNSLTKKQITLDLRLKLDTGENINVEMQSLSQKAFLERILFYWAKLYTEDLKKGESYQKLYPAYSLIFTNFDVLSLKDYMNSFSIRMDKEPFEELTNHLKIVIVELSKFECDDLIHLDKKASWCYVLKESENIGIREIEILEEKGLGGAMALLKRVSEDDRLRYEQESRDKFLFDQHWDRIYKFEEGMEKGIEKGIRKGIEKGREEGLQKGREEGRDKRNEEIVLRMLDKNLDFSFISELTGISEKEIKKIQKK